MARQQQYVANGKEFTVWTETQLSSINRDALKKRCLDFRDHVGQDRLPPMPRHPEGMVTWMLQVQQMAMGVCQPAAYQASEEYDEMPPPAPDRGPRGGAAYGGYDQEPAPRGYDQAPPSRHYAPSDAGSVAESRVGPGGCKMFVFEGREYHVWTEKQLSAMGRESLKNRCMDFRDNIGKDRLRPMPRHTDGMVEWLVDAQAMVMQGRGNGNATYDDQMADYARGPPGGMAHGGRPEDMPRGGPANNYPRDYEPSEAPSEAQSNYETNMRDAQAIRQKNQGSRGLW